MQGVPRNIAGIHFIDVSRNAFHARKLKAEVFNMQQNVTSSL
jgi:hypothetical protein